MKIMARELASAAAACSQVVNGGARIPILGTIRMAVSNGAAEFIGTNTEQTITCRRAVDGNDGIFCINAEVLRLKVPLLKPDAPVEITAEDGKQALIQQGRTRWTIPLLLDDYPMTVAEPVAGERRPAGGEFIAALAAVRSAVRPGDSGHSYGGVWLDEGHVVAIDGKQMRIIDTGRDIGKCVLPLAAADTIIGLFKGARSIDVSMGAMAAQFAGETFTLKTRLIDVPAGPWRDGIKRWRGESVNSCFVDSDELDKALRRASAIAASGEKAGSFINMQLRFRTGEIEIYTRNPAGEEGIDFVTCEGGAESAVGMNGAAVIDALSTMPRGRVRLWYGGPSHALLMEPEVSERVNVRSNFPRMFT